jgi:hypothetical protein
VQMVKMVLWLALLLAYSLEFDLLDQQERLA